MNRILCRESFTSRWLVCAESSIVVFGGFFAWTTLVVPRPQRGDEWTLRYRRFLSPELDWPGGFRPRACWPRRPQTKGKVELPFSYVELNLLNGRTFRALEVIDSRTRKRSTALVINIDFEAWGEYLGDPPIAMALLDRVMDGAISHKFQGKSYRAHRARRSPAAKQAAKASTTKR